ncbi:MAG TPA: TIGR03663 family protein [Candidatus Aminicenantes bacterium]|nr:TIGR03663 family protein [Candidatus Aminicenantes bacterium]
MTKKAFAGLFIAALAGALAFRFVRADIRPMHHDEANQAVKIGDLLERGEYRFDPQDHHGPTLCYLTLPAARAAGARTLADLDETTLRAVPALFGAGLLLLFLLFEGGISREAALAAAALAAVSPALSYYSRFYIQETLLVFFLAALLGTGWRYARTRKAGWALAAGVSAGLMLATKETSLVLLAGLAAAFAVVAGLEALPSRRGRVVAAGDAWVWRDRRVGMPAAFHVALFVIAAAAAAALFYSSFLRHPEGLVDAFRAAGASIVRGARPDVHAHPWPWYFELLAWFRAGRGPVWSEGFLLFLALAGAVSALVPDAGRKDSPRLLRFVLLFTIVTAAAYSLVPYKTPWNVLPFYFGLVLLAGSGAAALVRLARPRTLRTAVTLLLASGFAFQAFQAWRANFRAAADPSNPYVYAQTVPDFLRLVAAVERAAADSPAGKGIFIQVVAPPDETWPLPWYLRAYERVGYWTDPAGALAFAGTGEPAAVIASAGFAEEIGAALGEDYDQNYFGLRPEVPLCLFTRRAP